MTIDDRGLAGGARNRQSFRRTQIDRQALPPGGVRTKWGLTGGVFLLALVVRLLFLFTSLDSHWPHSLYYQGDAPVWVDYATALNQGEPFESDLPLRSPGVAYVLHFLSSVSGGFHFAGFKVLWCVATAGACALAYLCMERDLGRRTAWLGAMFCTFSFGSYVISTSLNNEALYLFVLMLVIAGTLRLREGASLLLSIGLGVGHGLATLLRPEHTLLLVLLSGYSVLSWAAIGRGRPERGKASESVPRRGAFPSGSPLNVGRAAGRKHARASLGHGTRRTRHPNQSSIVNHQSPIANDSAPALRGNGPWRHVAVVVMVSVLVCSPWCVRGSAASRRFNETAGSAPDYAGAALPWTEEARAFLEALPAFVRADNFAYLTHLCAQEGDRSVTRERVEELLLREFAYIPEPLSAWTFVSSQGPLSFALANHPRATGGFMKAALDARFASGEMLHLALPSHLRLYNRGYRVGLGYIIDDPARWFRLVGAKLCHFAGGVTLGFTGYNLPMGRAGERRPVDLMTHLPGTSWAWRICWVSAILVGAVTAVVRRCGGIWLLVIGYKLIVTMLFYGYARQAVSIGPAYYALAAIAVDLLLGAMGNALRLTPRRQWAACAAAVLILLGIEVHAGMHVRPVRVTGSFHAAPRWGGQAIETFERIEFHPLRSEEVGTSEPPDSSGAGRANGAHAK